MADKYFQLVVPNYDRSGSSTRGAPLSYLRLGRRLEADALPARDDRGDELVEHLAFEDDERSPTLPGKAYVRDDGAERESRSGEEAAEFREELTEDLLDRGGWRDHTDGNRISTTRGDCVEVVGGNYKLCVLGRVAHRWDPEQDDAGNGATANPNVKRCWWESAGGHSIEAASCGEEMLSITWTQDAEDGTWKTLEQTDHGDLEGIYHGRVEKHFFGPSLTAKIGCGVEAKGHARAHPAQRPIIEETTYASSITVCETVAGAVAENKTVRGFGELSEKTEIRQSGTRTFEAASHTELKAHAVFSEQVVATSRHVEKNFTGWKRTISLGALSVGAEVLGAHLVHKKGGNFSFHLGVAGEVEANVAKVDVTVCPVGKVRIGPEQETKVGATLELCLMKNRFWIGLTKAALRHAEATGQISGAGLSKLRLFGLTMKGC